MRAERIHQQAHTVRNTEGTTIRLETWVYRKEGRAHEMVNKSVSIRDSYLSSHNLPKRQLIA